MGWKKIDDTQATAGMPYSSFLADGLASNINAYTYDLSTGGCIAWPAELPPTWASYEDPQGTVIMVNCGQNAQKINFRVNYKTVTANGDGDPSWSGLFTIRHLSSQVQVTAGVVPSASSVTYMELTLHLASGPVSGPQAFFIGFQSYIVGVRGQISVAGVNQNSVSMYAQAGDTYTLTNGKKFEAIDLAASNNGPMSAQNARKIYQMCFVTAYTDIPASHVGYIWPTFDTIPSYIDPVIDPTKTQFGIVYELGAFEMYSISYNVVEVAPGSQIRQLSHGLSYSLAGWNTALDQAQIDFRPDVANAAVQRQRLGYICGAPVTHIIMTQSDLDADIVVSFHCMRLSTDTSEIDFHLELLDDTGALISESFSGPLSVARMTYAATYSEDTNKFRAMAGITSIPTEWGMIDSIPLVDALKGTPIRLQIGAQSFSRVKQLPSNVYTLKMTPNQDCYIWGYNAGLQ